MVQSVLFFALGFLCAGFLALIVAPAVWQRAVALTRRRIEASIPLTQAEIQADKDRVRAEYAMATRRLEMNVKALREKAAEQLVEINRGREALKPQPAGRRAGACPSYLAAARKPASAINCRCAASAPSSHLRNSAPVIEVVLNAPFSMYSFQSGVARTLFSRST